MTDDELEDWGLMFVEAIEKEMNEPSEPSWEQIAQYLRDNYGELSGEQWDWLIEFYVEADDDAADL